MPIHTKNWYSCPPYSWWGGGIPRPPWVSETTDNPEARACCVFCIYTPMAEFTL